MGFTVEILSVGNELLIGKTINTNLTWLSRQLSHIGAFVRRAVTVRDEISEIAEAVKLLLDRRPDVIIIGGGLGPTFDDKTLQGLSFALGTPIKLDREALKLIKASVGELNPARLKMAHIPMNGRPIPNPLGTAPGVRLAVGPTEIIALPGVPSEMRSMFRGSVLRFLRRTYELEGFYEASFLSTGIPESMIAQHIDDCMNLFAGVYIKSHPLGVEKGRSRINLHITSTRSANAVEEATEALRGKIRAIGGVVSPS